MIENLQTLRAFAAINVVYFHIIGIASSYGMPTDVFLFLQGWGANGVDIFFVISGFVMLHTQMQNKRSVSSFYVSRLVRIVPTYWFVTSLFVALLVVPGVYRATTVTPEWTVASYLFISQSLLGQNPLNGVGWTLEWEMLFYAVFGASLVFKTWEKSALFTFLTLSLVAYVSKELIIFEFFGGMVVAYIYNTVKITPKVGGGVLVIGVLWLLMYLVGAANITDISKVEVDRLIVWGLPSCLIVLGGITIKQFSHPIARHLGDASYSIYLIQLITIPGFYRILTSLHIDLNGDVASIACLVVSVLCGSAMYLLIEKPITNVLRRKVLQTARA